MPSSAKKLRITPKGASGTDAVAESGAAKIDAAKATSSNPGAPPGAVELGFNPKEYTIEQSNTYAEIAIPGLEAPLLQFVRGNTERLTFDTLIDCTEHDPKSPLRDASILANKIMKLARIDGELHAPPICKFEWGGDVMEGVIESVRRQFLLFDPDGKPTRIALGLSVKRYRSLKDQIADINKRSPDRTRTVVVVAGDTLPAIAARVYGDDNLWRPIAAHNQLENPARLRAGTVLEIPKLEARP